MFFFVRTENPRPTFHLDMTEDERSIMERHVAYWSEKAEKGIAVVFGPVMDPRGVYGVGVNRFCCALLRRTRRGRSGLEWVAIYERRGA